MKFVYGKKDGRVFFLNEILNILIEMQFTAFIGPAIHSELKNSY